VDPETAPARVDLYFRLTVGTLFSVYFQEHRDCPDPHVVDEDRAAGGRRLVRFDLTTGKPMSEVLLPRFPMPSGLWCETRGID
jgi:hypothetical protein